jgi:uncharacterized protein YecE (DUF72 family)
VVNPIAVNSQFSPDFRLKHSPRLRSSSSAPLIWGECDLPVNGRERDTAGVIKIGTSGFSYDDWVGPVYPEGLHKREQLTFYARLFATVELNVTYYRIPEKRIVEGWVRKTPPDFLFAVKAFQELTHGRVNPDYAAFAMSLRPLVEAGKLGCVLAQFPNSFRVSVKNREYLSDLRRGLSELPVVLEFRHSEWASEAILDLLRRLDFGYCCVDEPRLPGLMPPMAAATGPVAYVRFHGRNSAKWYNHKEAWERYDYTYSIDELREWVPRLRSLDAKVPLTLVYFNNHFIGQAVRAAQDLSQLLLEE